MEEHPLQDRQAFRFADVFQHDDDELLAFDADGRGGHPQVPGGDVGGSIDLDAAFPHDLGVLLAAFEDGLDGAAGGAVGGGSAAVGALLRPHAAGRLTRPLRQHVGDRDLERSQRRGIGRHNLPLVVEDHDHVGHGIEGFAQQGQALDRDLLAAEFLRLGPAGGCEKSLRHRG